MLLQEFDPNPSAVINPWGNIKPVQDCPRVAVSCFELRTFDRMVERLGGVEIMRLKKANWDAPVYRTEYKGVEIALFEAYVGAAGCMGSWRSCLPPECAVSTWISLKSKVRIM